MAASKAGIETPFSCARIAVVSPLFTMTDEGDAAAVFGFETGWLAVTPDWQWAKQLDMRQLR